MSVKQKQATIAMAIAAWTGLIYVSYTNGQYHVIGLCLLSIWAWVVAWKLL